MTATNGHFVHKCEACGGDPRNGLYYSIMAGTWLCVDMRACYKRRVKRAQLAKAK